MSEARFCEDTSAHGARRLRHGSVPPPAQNEYTGRAGCAARQPPVAEPEQTDVDHAAIKLGGVGLLIAAIYARDGGAVPDTTMDGDVGVTFNGSVRVGAAGNEQLNSVTRSFDQGATFKESPVTEEVAIPRPRRRLRPDGH
jgi:hypothetical protein